MLPLKYISVYYQNHLHYIFLNVVLFTFLENIYNFLDLTLNPGVDETSIKKFSVLAPKW